MRNPMMDKNFLYDLNQYKHKEIYARIISLSFDEKPLEQIEGRVISGSINIDGNSAVRRTCNLSLIAKNVHLTDFYWGVSNKFTLEIGVKNTINFNYSDIIWFKQGIYVITSFNSTLTQNNYTISINGKDKMCLLNGDMAGNLPASIDFGKIDTYKNTYSKVEIKDKMQYKANKYYIYQDGEYVISLEEFNKDIQYYTQDILLEQEHLTIKDIIREAIHSYGKEMYHNIIINDLDDYGLELVKYRGDVPLYLLYNEDLAIYDNMVIDKDFQVYLEKVKEYYIFSLVQNITEDIFNQNPGLYYAFDEETKSYYQAKNFESNKNYFTRTLTKPKVNETSIDIINVPIFNTAINNFNESRSIFYLEYPLQYNDKGQRESTRYSISKLESEDVAGYRVTDLTYPGDLISSIGESLTSILDKIKNMLGAFEYFYDLDGRFIFQAKKVYSQNSWNTLVNSDYNTFSRDAVEESPYSYSFEDVNLIQKFQNTPILNNVKNDYSIWGTRKSVTGAEIPIHARYAIHNKPKYYKAYDGKIYCSDEETLNQIKAEEMEKIIEEVKYRIQNFKPQYGVKRGLLEPQRNEDGSWSPGWWDIRDWHDYYYALRREEPKGTMKWYSHNSIEGCQRLLDIFPNDFSNTYRNSYVWLIIISPTGKINIQHGSGNPYDGMSTCTYYESYLNEDGSYTTVKSNPVIRKDFIPPFSGCSDTHTYLEFLINDVNKNGNSVYFFNPKFPGMNTFDEAVQNQIEKEFAEMLASGKINLVDWREIIYQMSLDFFKYNQEDNFLYNIHHNNLHADKTTSYYPGGETGYETFYTDMQGFWRQLYDPNPPLNYDTKGGEYIEEKVFEPDGITYKIQTKWVEFKKLDTFNCDFYLKGEPEENVKQEDQNYSLTHYYWNKNTILAPELLNFWIDFYEGNDSLSQYSIQNIGNRPKVVNNSKITSIYFRNVPQVIFTNSKDYNALDIKTGYTYVWLSDEMTNLFDISSQGKSAEEEMNELFNQYSYCTEGLSITTIPIYYLEPNTLIHIHNEENHISGKYQVNKITVPLTYNGTMSISATKVIDPVY